MSEINHAAIEVLKSFYEGDPQEQRDTFEALQRAAAESAGWISVKDRMPREHGTVLVHAPDNGFFEDSVIPALYNVNQLEYPAGFLSALPTEVVERITHWMPLPEPPNEAETK